MRSVAVILALLSAAAAVNAQIMISGNENKIDLSSGVSTVVPNAGPDSISILNFSQFPPSVTHVEGIRNSVIGPPSNIAILPDESLALIASSLLINPKDKTKTTPDQVVYVLDLQAQPPAVIAEVKVGKQPSGISITRDGKRAVVANRASGTVSLLSIMGKEVRLVRSSRVCPPGENVADVAIHPSGAYALASVCKGRYLRVIDLKDDALKVSDRKISVYGEPYRCVITPDGALALTAGSGFGAPDADAVSIVDLTSDPIRTIDYVAIPNGPESLEISPDGKMVAVVLMNGSNLPADKPLKTDHGLLVILARRGSTFEKVQEVPTARIPEGVAFSPDGKQVVVQGHPDRQLWLYTVEGEQVKDTGERISVPGFPSSLRIAEKPVAQ